MQSSTAVACRVLVMLACLIAVPLAAIFGSSFSDVARRLFGGHWGGPPESARQSLAEAPGFGPPLAMAGDPTEPSDAPKDAPAPASPARPDVPTPSGVIHAGLELPLPSMPADRSGPLARSSGPASQVPGQAGEAAAVRPSRARLAQSFPTASPPLEAGTPDFRSPGSASSGPVAEQAPAVAANDRRALAVEQRLQELGVKHYLLEPWGTRGQLYRFHCKVPIGDHSTWTRFFQATDPDPFKAMTRVLRDVEAWQAGRP